MRYDEHKELNQNEKIDLEELDKAINQIDINRNSQEDLMLIKRYLERMMLIIERSRIRDYMMLADSKRRLFYVNFVSGLGRGFGQAIGFTFLAAMAVYLVSRSVDLPIIGKYISEIIDIVKEYQNIKR